NSEENVLFLGGIDGAIRLWCLNSGELINELIVLENSFNESNNTTVPNSGGFCIDRASNWSHATTTAKLSNSTTARSRHSSGINTMRPSASFDEMVWDSTSKEGGGNVYRDILQKIQSKRTYAEDISANELIEDILGKDN